MPPCWRLRHLIVLKGCLFGVLGVAVGLGVVAEAADIGARHFATHKVEQRIHQVVPGATGIHAHIHSWPFLKVGVNGHVDEVGAHIDRLSVAPLVFTNGNVDLRGVRVSVSNMVTGLRVDVTRVAHGSIALTLTAADLDPLIPGVVALPQLPLTVDAKVRRLVISMPGGRTVTYALPGPDLMPCVPTVTPSAGATVLSCTFTQVPRAFTTATTT